MRIPPVGDPAAVVAPGALPAVGVVRCGVCQRKMAGEMVRKHAYYRCAARTLAPGSAALADHPSTVNLREYVIVEALNRWIGRLFHPENVDETIAELWWGTPGRPQLVETFVAVLDDPDHNHWGPGGAWRPRLPREPGQVVDRTELRRVLLRRPWMLETEAADWVVSAGIGFLLPPLPLLPAVGGG